MSNMNPTDAPQNQPVQPTEPPAVPPQPPTAPAVPPAPAPQPPAPEAAAPAKKVLLVEDDDDLASVYVTRLKAEGFEVRRVPNGEDALTAALEYRPALIILDVMMPQVNGFDVLDIIRNTPEIGGVKIIMLTALSQEADKQRARDLGADDYLVKSQVVIADVVDRIRHHLDIR